MKTCYNTHVRKLEGVDIRKDADTLTALLKDCRGSKVLLRVKQGGQKIDVNGSGPDLETTLRELGVNVGVPFDAEILLRDPETWARDPDGVFRDRNDWNTLHWNGERGTGEPAGSASLRNTPMFFRENGSAVDLIDQFAGGNRSVFLILNGQSFGEPERELLRDKPGIMTFGVNNGGHVFRPDFWTCVDDPTRFVRSIWEDGRIQKFVPMAHFEKRIWDRKSDTVSREKVKAFPNVIGYRRNEAFHPEQWLREDTINWGNHKSRGGGRSVMLVALRICWLLGFRRVYLVGCDFAMSEDQRYWFPEQRSEQAIRNNTDSYRILTEYFEALRPQFERAGFEVFNCNPESRLRAFPTANLAEAVASAAVDVSESTEGMYVKREKK